MKRSCAAEKAIGTGTVKRKVPAIGTGQLVEYVPCIDAGPGINVILLCVFR